MLNIHPKLPQHFQFLLPLLNLLLLPSTIFGHIILTFPEARYPPFDFLDSPRTLGPCGVPKSSRSPQTHFQLGKSYKLSWRMATKNENDTIRLSLLNESGNFVPNGVRSKNADADPLISSNRSGAQFAVAEFFFPSECRNCTLLLEKQGEGNLERSCAEIDIKNEELSLTERCSENGKWVNGHCQCEHGFSGEFCQNRDDCSNDSECGHGGKCIQDGVIPGQKSCFCQFGFFGTNCDRTGSDPDPADQQCFHHNGPSPSNADGQFLYGLFNPECYQRKDLNENDRLYWRLLGNHLELLLDFATNSWVALGWRPLQIPPSCRLFPQIEASTEIELAKTSGFAKDWLESPLHPMDCVDLVMGSVVDGTFLHIADMYSRDRSSPLKDGWLDGEESLSAAYGFKSNTNQTILMFRRLVPEIEPTDHPLGPGPIFVIFAKGGNSKADVDGQWKHHGNEGQNRGHLQLEFVLPSQMNRIRGPLIRLESTSAESITKEEKTTTIKTTELFSSSPIPTTITPNAAKSKLSKESKGIGSIWMRTKENNAGENGKLAITTTTTMESGLQKEKTTKSATRNEENEVKLDEQKQHEKGNRMEDDGREEQDEDENDEREEKNSSSNHVGIRNSGGDGEEWEKFLTSSSMALPSSFQLSRLLIIFISSSSWLILRLHG